MNARIFGLAVMASVALLAGGVGQASATTCTGEYDTSNGTKTLPGTDIGTVAAGCEIGPFSALHGANGNVATVNNFSPNPANPSIYQFTWTGGNLTIQEELGNNGTGHYINAELGLLSAVTLNANGSLASALASVVLPYASGLSVPAYVINNMNLAAGVYVLDTYIGACAPGVTNCSGGTSDDPQYQVLFTPGSQSETGAAPLPGALVLFGSALGGLGGLLGLRRRRRTA